MRLQLNQAALAALLASASLVESRYRYAGCFSGLEIQHHGNYMFQSRGYCERRCSPRPVFGLSNGTSCFCGEVTPPFEQRVEEGHCNVPCAGYPINTCGGMGFFSIYVQEPTIAPNETISQSQSAEPTETREAVAEDQPVLRIEVSDGSFEQQVLGA